MKRWSNTCYMFTQILALISHNCYAATQLMANGCQWQVTIVQSIFYWFRKLTNRWFSFGQRGKKKKLKPAHRISFCNKCALLLPSNQGRICSNGKVGGVWFATSFCMDSPIISNFFEMFGKVSHTCFFSLQHFFPSPDTTMD